MGTVTVGQASGLIALGVLALQFLLPLSVVTVLVSFLRNEHNAVTWSVVGRTVQSSLWPAILRTDSVSSRRVSFRVLLLSWLITLSLMLLAIAGVVTPLGLSESIKADGLVTAHFQYVPDLTGYGYGTPPRYNRFSRLCGGGVLGMNCPGHMAGYDIFRNATGWYNIPRDDDAIINSTIPANLTEIFASATSDDGNTLSGAFDIQYRTWSVQADVYRKLVDGGKPYSKGEFRNLEMLVLHDKVEVVEGLVVDTVRGGVGFRNHTVPLSFKDGGEWSEDLTWVEPVTSCVDTNLTFLIQTGDRESNITGVSLVDEGGFVDLPRMDPFMDELYGSQELNLQHRAQKGAYSNAALSMFYYNVSFLGNTGPRNTSKGRQFPLPKSFSAPLFTSQLTPIDGHYLELTNTIMNSTGLDLSSGARSRLSVGQHDFTHAEMNCQGFGLGDRANISNVAIHCGYLFGAPRRTDGKDLLIFEPETRYTQSMHVCASALQASIKTVKFSINGTASLANLRVDSVVDKVYQDNASKPLWAVEKTGRNISQIQPLWGLVHDRYEDFNGLWTLRREKFWLPAISDFRIMFSVDSLASTTVFGAALSTTFNRLSAGKSDMDYSGQTNVALNRRWQDYSRSAATAGNIINLITADILAAGLVGTKSTIMRSSSPKAPDSTSESVLPPNARPLVRRYKPQLQYKLLYAIPAVMILLFATAMITMALIMWIFRRFHLSILRQLLNQTSTGRTVTNILYPELCDPQTPTKKWVDEAGGSRLAFSVDPRESGTGTVYAVDGASGNSSDDHHKHSQATVEEQEKPASSRRVSTTLRFGGAGGTKSPLYRVLSQRDLPDD